MWVFLSSRVRTWVLLAVAIPLVRTVIRRAHAAAERRNPDAAVTSVLGRAEALFTRFERRRRSSD